MEIQQVKQALVDILGITRANKQQIQNNQEKFKHAIARQLILNEWLKEVVLDKEEQFKLEKALLTDQIPDETDSRVAFAYKNIRTSSFELMKNAPFQKVLDEMVEDLLKH